jgi:hypothetical protein
VRQQLLGRDLPDVLVGVIDHPATIAKVHEVLVPPLARDDSSHDSTTTVVGSISKPAIVCWV